MAAPFLRAEAGLDEIRDDLVYLKHKLHRDPSTRDLAKPIAALITEWTEIHAKQLAHWDAQTVAQVDISIADDKLDARVDLVDNDLRRVVGNDRESARYRLYIAGGVYELKRPVLGEELATLRDWHQHLATEEDESLVAHRDGLGKELDDADTAIKARDDADAKNAQFRSTGDFAKYTQKVIDARDRVWAELESRRAKQPTKLPRDWASSFFRPRAEPALSEAERTARAAAREKDRQERAELARKRKEASDKLREAKREVAALKKPRKPAR